MRTTVRLEEHLLREAKQLAARSGGTLTGVIETALKEMLGRRAKWCGEHRQRCPRSEEMACSPEWIWMTAPGCSTGWRAAMIVVDVNVLVHTYREDAPQHRAFRSWLEKAIGGDESFGSFDLILSGFLRVVTHPRVFSPPSPVAHALDFVRALRDHPNCVHLTPGPRHWEIFAQLCRAARAKGTLIPDAYLAAFVIETGNEWITTDRDYSRFPALRWRHPLESG